MTLPENTLFLADADQTSAFGRWLAPQLGAGDVLLLDGPVGAGKSHLARAVIQFRLAQDGVTEDVPSPSFTLIQTYPARIPIVHADLYRINSTDDSTELGLTDTLDQVITLIEWPASIFALLPKRALTLRLRPDDTGDARRLHLSSPDPRWQVVMQVAASRWGPN
jgi:tRNA threonylcarbamoyl adenosine modification protein YjeE